MKHWYKWMVAAGALTLQLVSNVGCGQTASPKANGGDIPLDEEKEESREVPLAVQNEYTEFVKKQHELPVQTRVANYLDAIAQIDKAAKTRNKHNSSWDALLTEIIEQQDYEGLSGILNSDCKEVIKSSVGYALSTWINVESRRDRKSKRISVATKFLSDLAVKSPNDIFLMRWHPEAEKLALKFALDPAKSAYDRMSAMHILEEVGSKDCIPSLRLILNDNARAVGPGQKMIRPGEENIYRIGWIAQETIKVLERK